MAEPAPHLKDRRAARRRQLRRRRALAMAAVVCVLALVALLVRIPGGGSRGHGPAPAASPAQSRRAPAVTHEARAAEELAAVRRLAAYGLPLFCGGRSKRTVALTFDDGPGPYTRLAVAKLRKHHARATFFLVGKEIAAYPGLVGLEQAVAVNGDHTLTHPFLPSLGQAAMVQEIAGAKRLIEQTTGKPVALFRPPYEGRSPAIDAEVRKLGMLEVLWNVDSADSLGANYAAIERTVIAGLHPGSIILMHENHGQTIRALLAIFAALERDHLRAVTIPELVAEDPPTLAQLRAGGLGCGTRLRAGSGA